MKPLSTKRSKSIAILGALLFLFSILSQAESVQANETKYYSFGVVPQQSAKRLATLWGPVLQYLSKETGIKLKFKTAKDIPTFEKQLSKGEYDFAYMNPYHFTVYSEKPGYKALAARKNQPISGILVARKDSNISSLQQLADKTLAFPSPAAFAASILPQAELNKQAVSFSPKYVSSHDSVYLAVAKGLIPAGGGVKRTFNNTQAKVREQLKIIWTSKKHTPHAFASHPGIPSKTAEALQKALIAMGNTPEGKKLLTSLKIKNGLILAENHHWDDVKELNIQLLNKAK